MPRKVALIGAGGITYAHVPAWLALGAEVSVFAERGADRLAARFGLRHCTSFEEAVQDADVVDICTPTPLHVEHALRAIAAGKDVVCEKPVARHAADAQQVVDAAAAAGVRVLPGHVVRYFPEYAAVKQAVDAGRVGRLAVLRFSRQGPAPASDWFFDLDASGGLVMDQMIHDLDAARWIAGEVVQVYAVQSPAAEGTRLARRTAAQVVLTHRSGAISHIRGAWTDPGVVFTTSFDIAGDAGRLSYDSRRTDPLTANLAATAGESSYLPGSFEGNPYQTELADFLAGFDGAPTRVDYLDGIVAVRLAEAALESIATGRAVDLAVDRDEAAAVPAPGVHA